MKTLYIGDIMGQPGVMVVKKLLPAMKKELDLDLVIAQTENVTQGKGISLADFQELKALGIDFCTGGNWSLFRPDILGALSDPDQPVIRPANYPDTTPGKGWKFIQSRQGRILVVSLLGHIVGRDADKPTNNPLIVIDGILKATEHQPKAATFVNFHGDYSSEKRVIGYYLDGRVTAVIGDHWHVPTADAMVLPHGTAHISDVGMCGVLHSSLGIKLDTVIARWRDKQINRNELEMNGPWQFNAVVIESDIKTGLALGITPIQKIVDSL